MSPLLPRRSRELETGVQKGKLFCPLPSRQPTDATARLPGKASRMLVFGPATANNYRQSLRCACEANPVGHVLAPSEMPRSPPVCFCPAGVDMMGSTPTQHDSGKHLDPPHAGPELHCLAQDAGHALEVAVAIMVAFPSAAVAQPLPVQGPSTYSITCR